MSYTNEQRFIRNQMLLGADCIERLAACHVVIVGLGGVGSYAAEAVARAGVGKLTLVDHDDVDVSNINRQLCALTSTVGQKKAEVVAVRLQDINPQAQIDAKVMFYDETHREELFAEPIDYIIDAIDSVGAKLDLIETAIKRGIPIISALGTGNKLDPSQLTITDLSKTSVCPLARVVRRELKVRGIVHHEVLYSTEQPLKPLELVTPSEGKRSVPGSIAWVPSCAGLMMGGHVIRKLMGIL